MKSMSRSVGTWCVVVVFLLAGVGLVKADPPSSCDADACGVLSTDDFCSIGWFDDDSLCTQGLCLNGCIDDDPDNDPETPPPAIWEFLCNGDACAVVGLQFEAIMQALEDCDCDPNCCGRIDECSFKQEQCRLEKQCQCEDDPTFDPNVDTSDSDVNCEDLKKFLEPCDQGDDCTKLTYQGAKSVICCFFQPHVVDEWAADLPQGADLCESIVDCIDDYLQENYNRDYDPSDAMCLYINCIGGGTVDCDANDDGKTECSDLQTHVSDRLEESCNNDDVWTADEVLEFICEFLEACTLAVPPQDPEVLTCENLVDCIQDTLCENVSESEKENGDAGLTMERLERLAECSGCDLSSCCTGLAEARHFDCGPTTEGCDLNCDGKQDAKDLALFLEQAAFCNSGDQGGTGQITVDYFIEWICLFASRFAEPDPECEGDFCTDLAPILLELAEEWELELTVDDWIEIVACTGCSVDIPGIGEIGAVEAGGGYRSCPPSGFSADGQPLMMEMQVNGQTANPVDPARGDKRESAVDLIVPLDGRNFVLSREYRSKIDYQSPVLSGERWTLSSLRFIELDPISGQPIMAGMASGRLRPGDLLPFDGTPVRLSGGTTQEILASSAEVDGVTYRTWCVREPGAWEMHFYRSEAAGPTYPPGANGAPFEALDGQLLLERDVYGSEWVYDYVVYGLPDIPAVQVVRLKSIALHDRLAGAPAATVNFDWIDDTTGPNLGRLRNVSVKRPAPGGVSLLTQVVHYRYMDESDCNLHPDLGTDGDLIQVVRNVRVDPSSGADPTVPVWWQTIQQYRYHGGVACEATNPSTGARGFVWAGGDHQLKYVIQPEQFEFYAQQVNASASPAVLPGASAPVLLAAADDAVAFDPGEDVLVVDLASKVLEEYDGTTGDVVVQHLQSACGCGGGGTQLMSYHYDRFEKVTGGSRYITLRVTEYAGGSYFRTCYYDTKEILADRDADPEFAYPYLVQKAVHTDLNENGVVDTGSGELVWASHYAYATESSTTSDQTPIAMYYPSAVGTYTPATASTQATYTPHPDDGLIHRYVFNGYNRRQQVLVASGESDSGVLVSETVYPTIPLAGSQRIHLPLEMRRFRVAGSSLPDDIEVTSYGFGFHDLDDDSLPDALASERVNTNETVGSDPTAHQRGRRSRFRGDRAPLSRTS